MAFIFANDVNTTLASPASSSATMITLSSTANFPTISGGNIWVLTLNDAATQLIFEILYVTAISGANLTVIRGQEGTAAQSWLAGDFAFGPGVTAAVLNSFAIGSGPGMTAIDTGPEAQTKEGQLTVQSEIIAVAFEATDIGSSQAFYVPISTSDGAIFVPNGGVTSKVVASQGGLAPGSTVAYVPPVLSADGGSLARTTHLVTGGRVTVTLSSASSSGTAIAFVGAAAFVNPPNILLTASTTANAIQTLTSTLGTCPPVVQAINVTAAGFTLVVMTVDGTAVSGTHSITVDWTATGA